MSRRWKPWAAVLVTVAATALVYVLGKPADTPAPGAESTVAREPAPAPEPPSEPQAGALPGGVRLPGMPPANAPLALALDPLVARADAGDAQAACRLAMELIRCESNRYLMQVPGFNREEYEAALEAQGNLDGADQIAEGRLAQIERARECRVVPASLQDRGPHYLGQAARAGHPEAMVRYADSQFWPPGGRGIFSDPEFDRWRRDAPGMLQRAFAAGVPEAPFLLMDAYGSDGGLVAALIPDDPVQVEALRLLMVRMHGWQGRSTPSPLDAASLRRARELAKQWHEGPFQGRRYHRQNRAMYPHAGDTSQGGERREFCQGGLLSP